MHPVPCIIDSWAILLSSGEMAEADVEDDCVAGFCAIAESSCTEKGASN